MGEKSEYSENVPSDLEFLGGHFNFMSQLALEGQEVGEGPALDLVKKVLLQALSTRSWDLSVQPFEESTLVRGKNDGSWRELMRFPAARHKEFTIEVSRLWCGVSELYWGLPFDGLLLLGYPDGDWTDIFLSAVPGIHGFIFKFTFVRREKSFDLDLDKLGFDAAGLRALKQAVDAPAGMVLATGPTHSGKSIVSYSSVMRRLRQGHSATTIERPRKFRLPGARQIHLKKYVNFHPEFPNALADDPRVLLVQDLGMYEDVVATLEAAKTRLVVAANHMHDVLHCLRRLHGYAGLDFSPRYDALQIHGYRELLSRNLSLVCSGRQVSLLCPSCKAAVEVPASMLERSGLRLDRQGSLLTFRKGSGCEACRGSGIAKRTGIYEVLPISPAMRRLLTLPVPACALVRQAREDGLVGLRETALKMALDGVISFQEAVSATPPPYFELR